MEYIEIVLIVLIVLYGIKVLKHIKEFMRDWILNEFAIRLLTNTTDYERITALFSEGYPQGLINCKCHCNAYNQAVRLQDTYKKDCEIVVCLCVGDDDDNVFVHFINREVETGEYFDVTLGAYGHERFVYYKMASIEFNEYSRHTLSPDSMLIRYKKQVIKDNFNWFERLFVSIDDI